MKKPVKEILIILLVSAVLAIGYNLFVTKIPWIYSPPQVQTVADSALFKTELNQDFRKPLLGEEPPKIEQYNKTENKEKLSEAPKPLADANKQVNSSQAKKELSKISADNSNSGKMTASNVKSVSYSQMLKIVNNPDFVIIDARPKDAYDKAHIGKAINLNPNMPEGELIPKLLNLPANKTYIVYCDGGQCDLSHELIEKMLVLNIKNIYIFSGGWEEWTKQGAK